MLRFLVYIWNTFHIYSNFRLNFSLTSASVQHFMIASEKEHIRYKMPENVIEQLRQIKERSLVISPDEIVSHVIFYSDKFNLSSHFRASWKRQICLCEVNTKPGLGRQETLRIWRKMNLLFVIKGEHQDFQRKKKYLI